MNDVISVGPLIIRTEMLLYVLSGIVGFLFMRYRLGKSELQDFKTHQGQVEDLLTGAVIAYLVAWKLSVLLFFPGSVMAEPLALLYMPGGEKGVILGVLVALAYTGLQVYRKAIPIYTVAAGFIFAFVMAGTVYFFIHTAFILPNMIWGGEADGATMPPDTWSVAFHTMLFMLLTLWLIRRSNSPLNYLKHFLIWFGIGKLLISLFAGQPQVFALGLSKFQWLYVGLALLGIFWPEGIIGRKGDRQTGQ